MRRRAAISMGTAHVRNEGVRGSIPLDPANSSAFPLEIPSSRPAGGIIGVIATARAMPHPMIEPPLAVDLFSGRTPRRYGVGLRTFEEQVRTFGVEL